MNFVQLFSHGAIQNTQDYGKRHIDIECHWCATTKLISKPQNMCCKHKKICFKDIWIVDLRKLHIWASTFNQQGRSLSSMKVVVSVRKIT